MLEDVWEQRIVDMSEQEKRWFNNIKKSFYESDMAFKSGHPEDRCFVALCQAIDTAKTLRRSLRGESTDGNKNRQRFIEFLNLEIPESMNKIELFDSRKQKAVPFSLVEMIYDIRCIMIHENENLNHAEKPEYHFHLDWSKGQESHILGRITEDRRVILNAQVVWNRIREILLKFISWIDSVFALHNGQSSFHIGIDFPLGSIRPDHSVK